MKEQIIEHIKDIVDFAEPKMDVYEFAIYFYLFRHTRLLGIEESLFGFKSIRKSLVIGVGTSGKPMSEGVCYGRLKSLEIKGFIKTLSSEHKGTRIKVYCPSEIEGLIIRPKENSDNQLDIEDNRRGHDPANAINPRTQRDDLRLTNHRLFIRTSCLIKVIRISHGSLPL